MPKFNLKRLQECADDWKALSVHFGDNEMKVNNRITFNPDTQEAWMPEPWIAELKKDPELQGLAKMFQPIPVEELAPMTDTMRMLCEKLGLPAYDGGNPIKPEYWS